MPFQPESYSQKVVCGNCHHETTIEIPKGNRISDERCPRCDCKTVHIVPVPRFG